MRATVEMGSCEAGIYTITYKNKTHTAQFSLLFYFYQTLFLRIVCFLHAYVCVFYLRIGSSNTVEHLKSSNIEMLTSKCVCVCVCLTACLSVRLYVGIYACVHGENKTQHHKMVTN